MLLFLVKHDLMIRVFFKAHPHQELYNFKEFLGNHVFLILV